MYEIIASFCVLGFIILSLFGVKGIYRRDETISDLKEQLEAERERIRLLNKLNPEPKDEDGWTFEYSKSTRFVGKFHKNGKGKISICELKPSRDDKKDIDYYGYRIAKLLNDGYITASPEIKVREVVLKDGIPDDELKFMDWGHGDVDSGRSKVPTIKVDTPMLPVKPPKVIKKCSDCTNVKPIQGGTFYYYACDKNYWFEKQMGSILDFAESTDCRDFEQKRMVASSVKNQQFDWTKKPDPLNDLIEVYKDASKESKE